MIFFPAIDLKDGQCVRLLRGEMDSAVVYNDSPARQAEQFERLGCEWIHLVDLDGATEGRPRNAKAVKSIIDSVDVHLQLGGGIRDEETIRFWLDQGIARVILGTAAARNPKMVERAAAHHPDRIAVAIDAWDGRVKTAGWAEDSGRDVQELATCLESAGAATIIYTDIERDGTMTGPNVTATEKLANSVSVPVIASGGVSSIADLIALKNCDATLLGAIAGRAIYSGAIDISEALATLGG